MIITYHKNSYQTNAIKIQHFIVYHIAYLDFLWPYIIGIVQNVAITKIADFIKFLKHLYNSLTSVSWISNVCRKIA